MKKIIVLLCAAFVMLAAVTGCSSPISDNTDDRYLPAEDIDPNGGADIHGANNHEKSKYWLHPDFYNMKSDDQVTIISHLKPCSKQPNTAVVLHVLRCRLCTWVYR